MTITPFISFVGCAVSGVPNTTLGLSNSLEGCTELRKVIMCMAMAHDSERAQIKVKKKREEACGQSPGDIRFKLPAVHS